MRILNRIVTWTSEGIDYEGDQRHVEICMNNLGLMAESREVGTPIEKERGDTKEKSTAAAALAKSSAEAVAEEEWLEGSDSTRYRGLIARMNYLGQDRSDIQYAVKELSSHMANPNQNGMIKINGETELKALVRVQ